MTTYTFQSIGGHGPSGPTGPVGFVATTDNLVVNTVTCPTFNVTSLASDSLTVSNAMLGPSVLPTFTSQMIGYTTYKTGAPVTVSAGNTNYTLNDDPLTLPAGVWLLQATCLTAAYTANYTLTAFYIGVAETLNANAYNNAPNGLRFTKNVGSWTVVYNDTRIRPTFTYSQVYHIPSGTKNLYGFFQLSGGGSSGSGTLSVSGSLHATRIA